MHACCWRKVSLHACCLHSLFCFSSACYKYIRRMVVAIWRKADEYLRYMIGWMAHVFVSGPIFGQIPCPFRDQRWRCPKCCSKEISSHCSLALALSDASSGPFTEFHRWYGVDRAYMSGRLHARLSASRDFHDLSSITIRFLQVCMHACMIRERSPAKERKKVRSANKRAGITTNLQSRFISSINCLFSCTAASRTQLCILKGRFPSPLIFSFLMHGGWPHSTCSSESRERLFSLPLLLRLSYQFSRAPRPHGSGRSDNCQVNSDAIQKGLRSESDDRSMITYLATISSICTTNNRLNMCPLFSLLPTPTFLSILQTAEASTRACMEHIPPPFRNN